MTRYAAAFVILSILGLWVGFALFMASAHG